MKKKKIAMLARQCDEILAARSQIDRGRVRRVAGLATWIAGIRPQVTAYTARLWAATTTSSEFISTQQWRPTIRWWRRLCTDDLQQVQRHCREPTNFFTLITFDAALTGGGAVLQAENNHGRRSVDRWRCSVQAGLKSLEEAATRPIIAYWHRRWEEDDFNLLKVKQGEPSGQAALEAYTLLISVATWSKVLSQAQGALHVRGDALGVLYNMLRFKSRDPVLNARAGELVHLFAPLGLDSRAAHRWSERNETCDKLSRTKDGEACDLPELQQAVRVKRLTRRDFGLVA